MDAQKQLLDAVHSNLNPSEMVHLQKALGRVLAQNAISTVNIPNYDKTFIDGYAINSRDTKDSLNYKTCSLQSCRKIISSRLPNRILKPPMVKQFMLHVELQYPKVRIQQ